MIVPASAFGPLEPPTWTELARPEHDRHPDTIRANAVREVWPVGQAAAREKARIHTLANWVPQQAPAAARPPTNTFGYVNL